MSDYTPVSVSKPITRSSLRSFLGREFYITKRKLRWAKDNAKYVKRAGRTINVPIPNPSHTIISHRSMLLRPLKGVDMYLQHNKIVNLEIAIRNINGVIIRPGKKMSVWKLVGRPTARKGYLEGLVLHNGQIKKGVGGGLCQLGNLLYWMALHTELEVTERWRHGFDVFPDLNRTIPFACGATLAYNYIDLEILNNTQDTYSISLWLDGEYLHGEIKCSRALDYKYEVYETDHSIKLQWWGGYTRHNRIWKRRRCALSGHTDEILIAENHAIMMYNPLIEGTSTG